MAKSYAEAKEEELKVRLTEQIIAQEKTLLEVKSLLNNLKVLMGTASEVKQFVISVGTSVVQLPDYECLLAIIKNDDDSSGNIFIGDSSVSTTNGFKLTPGSGIIINPQNLNLIYAVSDSSAILDIFAVR